MRRLPVILSKIKKLFMVSLWTCFRFPNHQSLDERKYDMHKQLNILQHMVMPNHSTFDKDIGLYFRASDKARLVDGALHIPAYQKVDFDTYFNYFPIKKWLDFGQIDSLFVQGVLCGTALLEVIGVRQENQAVKEQLLSRFVVGQSEQQSAFCEQIIGFSACEAIFVRVCTLEGKCELKSLEFGTNKQNQRQIKLALCLIDSEIGTQAIIDEITLMKNINGLDIDIINVDERENNVSRLACALRCVKDDRTHILSLSSQGFVTAESIFRAVRFFEMVFAERQDVMLAGSSVSNDDIDVIATYKAVAKGGSKAHEFSWHFCMFDKKIIRDFGLPLPLSLEQSAAEYKQRTYKEIVPLSGVAYGYIVPSNSLVQKEYHEVKDGIMTQMLQSRPDMLLVQALVWDRFWHNIHTYNYVAARLNLYALDHITKGTYQLSLDELDRLAQRLYDKENRFTRYAKHINAETYSPVKPNLLNQLKPYLLPVTNTNRVQGKRQVQDFIGRSRVLVVDSAGNVEIARIRRRKAKQLVSHAVKSYYLFIKNYKQIRLGLLQYRNAQKSFGE